MTPHGITGLERVNADQTSGRFTGKIRVPCNVTVHQLVFIYRRFERLATSPLGCHLVALLSPENESILVSDTSVIIYQLTRRPIPEDMLSVLSLRQPQAIQNHQSLYCSSYTNCSLS
jgi:hypothetical protein